MNDNTISGSPSTQNSNAPVGKRQLPIKMTTFIVVVVIVIVTLFYGHSSPGSTNMGSGKAGPAFSVSGFANFIVSSQSCSSSGLIIQLKNNVGRTVDILTANVTSEIGITKTLYNNASFGFGILSIEESTVLVWKGTNYGETCNTIGAHYNASISVDYSINGTVFVTSGTVSGNASAGSGSPDVDEESDFVQDCATQCSIAASENNPVVWCDYSNVTIGGKMYSCGSTSIGESGICILDNSSIVSWGAQSGGKIYCSDRAVN